MNEGWTGAKVRFFNFDIIKKHGSASRDTYLGSLSRDDSNLKREKISAHPKNPPHRHSIP